MGKDYTSKFGKVIDIDEGEIQDIGMAFVFSLHGIESLNMMVLVNPKGTRA